jgi:hypothetical protein
VSDTLRPEVEKTFETDGKTTTLTLFGPRNLVEKEVVTYFRQYPFMRFNTRVVQRTPFNAGWVTVGIWRWGTTSSGSGNRSLR